jgi:hypothetical protein
MKFYNGKQFDFGSQICTHVRKFWDTPHPSSTELTAVPHGRSWNVCIVLCLVASQWRSQTERYWEIYLNKIDLRLGPVQERRHLNRIQS